MRYIIDENGEILNELGEGDRIIRKNSINSYKKNLLSKPTNDSQSFTKVYHTKENIVKSLTGAECKILFAMVQGNYIRYETGLLFEKYAKKPLEPKEIAEISGVSEKHIHSYLNSLKKKEIIGVLEYGGYKSFIVNPYIFWKGSIISDEAKKLFSKSKWRS